MTKFEFYGKTIATYDADTVEEAKAIVKRYMKTRLHSGVAY